MRNYKRFIIPIVLLLFCSINVKPTAAPLSSLKKQASIIEFDTEQDSLRQVLLNSKSNANLKNSFLQEFYIRSAVEPKGDSLEFNIPFDLHGYDCGAPDCYITTVQFNIHWNQQLITFPKKLIIKEQATGCVADEKTEYYAFLKSGNNKEAVIYNCAEKSKTLVLVFDFNKLGSCAFYFDNSIASKITINKYQTFVETEIEKHVPFRSRLLTDWDYGLFLINN